MSAPLFDGLGHATHQPRFGRALVKCVGTVVGEATLQRRVEVPAEAEELLAQRGYRATSVHNIASALNIHL